MLSLLPRLRTLATTAGLSPPADTGSESIPGRRLQAARSECRALQAQAFDLAIIGRIGRTFEARLSAATDALDDADVLLLALPPREQREHFAIAAELHREMDHLRAYACTPPQLRRAAAR